MPSTVRPREPRLRLSEAFLHEERGACLFMLMPRAGELVSMHHLPDVMRRGAEEDRLAIIGQTRPVTIECISQCASYLMHQDQMRNQPRRRIKVFKKSHHPLRQGLQSDAPSLTQINI